MQTIASDNSNLKGIEHKQEENFNNEVPIDFQNIKIEKNDTQIDGKSNILTSNSKNEPFILFKKSSDQSTKSINGNAMENSLKVKTEYSEYNWLNSIIKYESTDSDIYKTGDDLTERNYNVLFKPEGKVKAEGIEARSNDTTSVKYEICHVKEINETSKDINYKNIEMDSVTIKNEINNKNNEYNIFVTPNTYPSFDESDEYVTSENITSQIVISKKVTNRQKKVTPQFEDLKANNENISMNSSQNCIECGKEFRSKTAYQKHLSLHNQNLCPLKSQKMKRYCQSKLESDVDKDGYADKSMIVPNTKKLDIDCKEIEKLTKEVMEMSKKCEEISSNRHKTKRVKSNTNETQINTAADNNKFHSPISDKSIQKPSDVYCNNVSTNKDLNSEMCKDTKEEESNSISSNKIHLSKTQQMNNNNCYLQMTNTSKMKTNGEATNKPYRCQICKKTFNKRSKLTCHVRIHTGEKPYSCHVCNKRFNVKGNLKAHVRVHTGEKPYSCEVCNETFKDKSILIRHTRIHTGEKPYSCEVCKKTFRQYNNLANHLRVHTGEKPFKCHICLTAFSVKSTLSTHLKIHTGEKPYSCNVCVKKFSEKGKLKSHLKVHSGEKPFSCDICKKCFAENSKLNRHIRTHTGEKRYSCHICNKKFEDNNHLSRHLQMHSRNMYKDSVT